jgi:CRP/FNR family transcriptional regulator
MDKWLQKYRSWRNFIFDSYQIRLNELMETLDSVAFLRMDERLLKYLNDKVKITGSTTLNSTHQDIASDMNTSRVVISRLMKQLEKQGKVKIGRNKLEVLNF